MGKGVRQRHSHRPRRHRPAAVRRRRSPERAAASRFAAHNTASPQTREAPPAFSPTRPEFRLSAVSGLIGAAAGFLVCALPGRLQEIVLRQGTLQPPYSLSNLAIGGFLLCFAVGLLLPSLLQRLMRPRLAQSTDPVEHGSRRPGRNFDPVLGWLILASLGLCAGLTIILLPAWQRLLSAVDASLHAAFVWSDAPLAIVHSIMAVATGAGPALLLGLALFGVHRLGGEMRTVVVPPLVGASVTAVATSIVSTLNLSPSSAMLQMGAALPALLAAVVAGLAAAGPHGFARETSAEVRTGPTLSGLRHGQYLGGIACVLAIMYWTSNDTGRAATDAGVFLLTAAAGFHLGERRLLALAIPAMPAFAATTLASGTALIVFAGTPSAPHVFVFISMALWGLTTGWIGNQTSNWEDYDHQPESRSYPLAMRVAAAGGVVMAAPIGLRIASFTAWAFLACGMFVAYAGLTAYGIIDGRSRGAPHTNALPMSR